MILAIDPGPQESAWLLLPSIGNRAGLPSYFGISPNPTVLADAAAARGIETTENIVIERVRSYGMPVGAEVFETCEWVGRFDPDETATLMPRKEVCMHLCQSARAKDPNIRQALIDRFGPGKRKAVGLKASPGPLYGVKSHVWSALALAVTYFDQQEGRYEQND